MRILYYNHSLRSPIGGGTHAREVFAELQRLPNVEAVSYPSLYSRVSQGVRTQVLKRGLAWIPKGFKLWFFLWVKPLSKELKGLSTQMLSEYDVIFYRPNALIRMIPAIKKNYPTAHLCVEVNAMIHHEVLKSLWPRRFWIWCEARKINSADSIMVVSDYLKDKLVNCGVPEEKILVNPNGANLKHFNESVMDQYKEFRKELNIPVDAFVLGYVGGMEPFRKLPLMVEQVIEVMQEKKNIYLVMAGSGEDRDKIEKICRESPSSVRSRIRYDGPIPYSRVPQLLASFNCALFPYSNPYGSPQKLFEYMAMGLPVIGPDVPVVREVFQDKKHLLLADQTGANFTSLVHEIVSNPEMAKAMAQRGQELIVEEYSWKQNAARLLNFLHQKMIS